MTDPSANFDPATTLARPDLAALVLEGRVRAEAYRATEPLRCVQPVADIHADASPESERIDQLLFGEMFDVLERRGGRVWGQARRDGTVGWMDGAVLAAGTGLPTHRMAAIDGHLPLNALLRAGDGASASAVEIGDFDREPIEVAERLLGVPHALGGRSSRGTDCSGLVQQALLACGLAGPRRSREQSELGTAVSRDDVRRGDIVVWMNIRAGQSWTGHSAFMVDGSNVLHATGHHGVVVVEALAEADVRYLAAGFDAAVFRRLNPRTQTGGPKAACPKDAIQIEPQVAGAASGAAAAASAAGTAAGSATAAPSAGAAASAAGAAPGWRAGSGAGMA